MTRTITVHGKEGRFDVPSFVLSENENLQILINAPTEQYGTYYINASNGSKTYRVCLKNVKSVLLPAEWLKESGAGLLRLDIELRDKTGNVVLKKYNVEPLELKEKTVGREYVSAVQKVEEENARLQTLVNTIFAEIAELKKRVHNYETNGVELIFEE